MVSKINLYGLDSWVWVCYLWLASAFRIALWFYKHTLPNTFCTHTCMQSHHICLYLCFFLECFTRMSPVCDMQHSFNFWPVCTVGLVGYAMWQLSYHWVITCELQWGTVRAYHKTKFWFNKWIIFWHTFVILHSRLKFSPTKICVQ